MKKLKFLSLLLSFILALSAVSFVACGNGGDTVKITYHLNYDDAKNREVEIYSGTYAVDWNAKREGFKLAGWYTDSACENAFDFSERVDKNTDLYAAWKVYEGRVAVTFDFNYFGSGSAVVRSIEKHEAIAEKYIPRNADRLGFAQNGWYKDEACTQKWDFETDTADSDLTLYAGYDRNDNIKRDADGNIVYDNVQINVWLSPNGQDEEVYQKIAEQFNKEYEGKIKVNASPQLMNQATFSLRSQNTPEKSVNEHTYYSVNDIYEMAGLKLDYNDWYEGALQDSIYQGAMTSIPMFANVPYLVYNKELVEKYNGDKPFPANYSELTALMNKVYEGEQNSALNTIYTNVDWTWKEGASSVAFLQNGAEYYSRENGEYINRWSEEAVRAKAETAMKNTYNMFSVNGSLHGGNTDTDTMSITAPLSRVAEGRALFGLINWVGGWAGGSPVLANDLDRVGYVPLSNLFTDDDTEEAKRIPINTFGLAFYKANDVSLTQLAAGAVFTDYCSKHSYEFTSKAWVPVRKSAYDAEKFDEKYKDIVTGTGSPENFYTYAAYTGGKNLYNTVAGETYIRPALNQTTPDFKKIISEMGAAIAAEVNN